MWWLDSASTPFASGRRLATVDSSRRFVDPNERDACVASPHLSTSKQSLGLGADVHDNTAAYSSVNDRAELIALVAALHEQLQRQELQVSAFGQQLIAHEWQLDKSLQQSLAEVNQAKAAAERQRRQHQVEIEQIRAAHQSELAQLRQVHARELRHRDEELIAVECRGADGEQQLAREIAARAQDQRSFADRIEAAGLELAETRRSAQQQLHAERKKHVAARRKLQKHCQQVDHAVGHQLSTIAEQYSQINRLAATASSRSKEIDECKRTNGRLQQCVTESSQQRQATQQQLARRDSQYRELQVLRLADAEAFTRLQNRLASTEASLAESQAHNQRLVASIEKLTEQLRLREQRHDETLASLSRQTDAWRDSNALLVESYAESQHIASRRIARLMRMLQRGANRHARATQEMESAAAAQLIMQSEMHARDVQVQADRIKQTEQEFDRVLKLRAEEYERNLESQRDVHANSLQQTLDELTETKGALTLALDKIKKLDIQLAEVQGRVLEHVALREDSECRLASCQDDVVELTKKLSIVQGELGLLQTCLESVRAESQQSEVELSRQLAAREHAMQVQHAELEQVKSERANLSARLVNARQQHGLERNALHVQLAMATECACSLTQRIDKSDATLSQQQAESQTLSLRLADVENQSRDLENQLRRQLSQGDALRATAVDDCRAHQKTSSRRLQRMKWLLNVLRQMKQQRAHVEQRTQQWAASHHAELEKQLDVTNSLRSELQSAVCREQRLSKVVQANQHRFEQLEESRFQSRQELAACQLQFEATLAERALLDQIVTQQKLRIAELENLLAQSKRLARATEHNLQQTLSGLQQQMSESEASRDTALREHEGAVKAYQTAKHELTLELILTQDRGAFLEQQLLAAGVVRQSHEQTLERLASTAARDRAEQQDKCNQLSQSYSAAIEQASELDRQLKELHSLRLQEQSQANETRARSQTQLQEAQAQLQEKQTQLQEKQAQLLEQQRTIATLRSKCANLVEHAWENRASMLELKHQTDVVASAAREDAERCGERLRVRTEESNEYRQRAGELQERLAIAVDRVTYLEEHRHALAATIDRLKSWHHFFLAEFGQRDARINALQHELTEDCQNHVVTVTALTQKIRLLTTELVDARERSLEAERVLSGFRSTSKPLALRSTCKLLESDGDSPPITSLGLQVDYLSERLSKESVQRRKAEAAIGRGVEQAEADTILAAAWRQITTDRKLERQSRQIAALEHLIHRIRTRAKTQFEQMQTENQKLRFLLVNAKISAA
ncbi:MAG: hypothetical protein KDB22_09040 [Planctomycetales bacterium]|nr:hypothetical protein [Planctomycetales bacterium]